MIELLLIPINSLYGEYAFLVDFPHFSLYFKEQGRGDIVNQI